jgi:cytochrome c5
VRRATIILLCLCLSACTAEEAGVVSAGASVVDAGPASEGQLAYEKFCADCHDSGTNGAPVIGKPQDWDERSPLWQAVLFEHAKEGFMAMPAKGGTPELSDDVVAAAAEYILETTFQDRLPD